VSESDRAAATDRSAGTASPLASAEDRPVLDAQVLSELERLGAAMGEDLVADLATLFLIDAEAEVYAIHQAIAAATDHTAVARSAHALRGASANVGAIRLAWVCEVLERSINEAEPQDAESLSNGLGSVEAELRLVRSAFLARTVSPNGGGNPAG